MRKILITNQSTGYLTTEIANAFVHSGNFEKVVIASGNEISPLLKLDKSIYIEQMPAYKKNSIFSRTLSWIKGAIWIVYMARGKYRDYELFLISNPPTVTFSSLFINNKYSTLIYDVYPNGLADCGFISKHNIIYKIWTKYNKKYYRKAEHVFTLTDGMKKSISEYCPIEKIEIVPLWSNPNLPVLNILPQNNKFIKENNLIGKFIIMYSGNIGKGHDLDVLIDVADKLKEYEDIVFIFIGDGYLKPIIKKKINDYGLENVILLPFQERSMLPYSLSCSNLAVVSTSKLGGNVCIPSKIFDLIKLGRPILCIAEPDSDISLFVKNHKIGESFSRDQIEDIAKFIIDMRFHPEKLKIFEKTSFFISKKYTSKLANRFIK